MLDARALCVQEACARMLLFRGVDKNLCNTCNQTASQLAALSGFNDLAALIDSFSSKDAGLWLLHLLTCHHYLRHHTDF